MHLELASITLRHRYYFWASPLGFFPRRYRIHWMLSKSKCSVFAMWGCVLMSIQVSGILSVAIALSVVCCNSSYKIFLSAAVEITLLAKARTIKYLASLAHPHGLFSSAIMMSQAGHMPSWIVFSQKFMWYRTIFKAIVATSCVWANGWISAFAVIAMFQNAR